jgi:pimeloyl-ACP methyl ester carboxylesterase
MYLLLWIVPIMMSLVWPADPEVVVGPPQPRFGPGGAQYAHDSVIMWDYAARPEGYWLFEPAEPRLDSAPVVIFNHGYGAYNPAIYGEWIRHLVRRGNIVVFPRYQKNLVSPKPANFPANVAAAIRDAFQQMENGDHARPIAGPLIMVGHSYGGTISAYLGVHYADYDLPQPMGIMTVSPGTGLFKGARLDDYAAMPADTRLLIVVSDNDRTVGDELGLLLFNTAVNTPMRNFLRQYPDDHGQPPITAGHNQAYSLYLPFDNGVRNVSFRRAQLTATTDAVDYFGYWKLFDALVDCVRRGENCPYAFGGGLEQTSLGAWSDGSPVRPLEATLP